MAGADWIPLAGGLPTSDVLRGATRGLAGPGGGGSFVYGFKSITTAMGMVALRAQQAGFAPTAKGGVISGAILRGMGLGASFFQPFLFWGAQGISVASAAYKIGLSDENPSKLILAKGAISDGLNVPYSTATETIAIGQWIHVRFQAYQSLGALTIKVFRNNIDSNPGVPVWEEVPGIDTIIDSSPLLGGYAGIAIRTEDMFRYALFDNIKIERQL